MVGVVTWLLSGGGEFQGRDRGRCALYCPFIEYPPLQPEVSRQLTRTSTSQPSKDAVGSKLPGGAKPASVNSGSPHQQADIGGVDNDKSWNRAWGSCATLVGD